MFSRYFFPYSNVYVHISVGQHGISISDACCHLATNYKISKATARATDKTWIKVKAKWKWQNNEKEDLRFPLTANDTEISGKLNRLLRIITVSNTNDICDNE